MRVVFPLLAVAVGVGLLGCVPSPDPSSAGRVPAEVTVHEVRADTLAGVLKEQKDKVVVVDFWATWCGPCVKNFPHLVELHGKYADKGLVCLSVSMDQEGREKEYQDEDGRAKVLAFLTARKAAFPNFVVGVSEADQKKLADLFGKGDGLPYLAVFDRAGRRVWDSETFPTKDADLPAAVEAEVQKQLAK